MSSAVSLHERLRLRELFKYVRVTPLTIPLCPAPIEPNHAFEQLSPHTPESSHDPPLDYGRASKDPFLTAFAQLAAVRLDCQHCLVSFFDGAKQHILAEATKTISLYDSTLHAPGDAPRWGTQSVGPEDCMSLFTQVAFIGGPEHWRTSDTMVFDSSRVNVCDLATEPLTKDLPVVKKYPNLRYYLEVPLITSTNYVVGSICVMDSAPRALAQDQHVHVLKDIAKLTLSHLELMRLKDDHSRAERLLQGLSHFNQGESSLRSWVPSDIRRSSVTLNQNHRKQFYSDTAVESPTNVRPRSHSLASVSLLAESPSPQHNQPSRCPRPQQEGLRRRMSLSSATNNVPITHQGTSTLTTLHNEEKLQKVISEDITTKEKQSVSFPAVTSIQKVFSRASNLIRESMDLEATCFLEISGRGRFQCRAKSHRHKSSQRMPLAPQDSCLPSDSDDGSVATSSAPDDSETDGRNKVKYCERLGFSTRFRSSVANSILARNSLSIPEELLNGLAHRYPSGRIFSFDPYGFLPTTGEDSTQCSSSSETSQPSRRRKRIASQIVEYFPNARSLIFLPLYDNNKQYLYAAFVGWTTQPERVLQRNEMIYVSGFANSIMCEVMRLETLLLDKAKSDFMSSMSHELRSPLHGILAATQLIQESGLSRDQLELANMVDTCGRTLLDIMNNLLDHAKINHFTEKMSSVRDRAMGDYNEQQETHSLTSQVDLSSLIEETVASIAAGHSVREHRLHQFSPDKRSSRSSSIAGTRHNETPDSIASSGTMTAPTVILDIQHHKNWNFETEAGTWRRIAMNLLGNSLKYTQSGHVKISLQMEEMAASRSRPTETSVILTVSDTGQGISQSYLKHRLYMPFAQENNLSVGAGLGLSIVNQLVSSLNGVIHIHSEIGIGTRITVTVPMTQSAETISSTFVDGSRSPQRASLATDEKTTVSFLGFDSAQEDSEHVLDIKSGDRATMKEFHQSLFEMARHWFGLDVVEDTQQAEIKFIQESHAASLIEKTPGCSELKGKVIVISSHVYKQYPSKDWTGLNHYVRAPIGPQKFGSSLRAMVGLGKEVDTIPRSMLYPEQEGIDGNQVNRLELTRSADHSAHSDDDATEHCKELSPVQDLGRSSRPRLLLVEDNVINLRILATFLRKLNLDYVTASNGQEALDRYRESIEITKSPIDCILMDVSMPIMDGLVSSRHIRAYEKEKKMVQPTKIIALTGLASEKAHQDALASGIDLFYRKPVKLDVLHGLLSKWEFGRRDEK